ncbi:hypothetical protein CRG98_023134 [Punica granatum]|uniref:Uncharacterized protein n=1 Tax=Punica granatum TaxID=22663 RepID=A0A2I0JLU4_PUNGR|nr:hypothetical protein CRG98_023134 [Punica granatum]
MGCLVWMTFVFENLVITTLEWLECDWGDMSIFSLVASRHVQSPSGRLEKPDPLRTSESNSRRRRRRTGGTRSLVGSATVQGVGKRTGLVGVVQAHRGACIGTHGRCVDGACMWHAVTRLDMPVVDRPSVHNSSCRGGRVKTAGGLPVVVGTTRLPCGVGGWDGLGLWSQRILLWRSEDRGWSTREGWHD